MACIMDMQVACFAFPLTFATPVTLALLMAVGGSLPYNFDVAVVETPLLWPLLGVAAAVWLSSVLVVRRTAWNTKMPRLALDEVLVLLSLFRRLVRRSCENASSWPPVVWEEAEVKVEEGRRMCCEAWP